MAPGESALVLPEILAHDAPTLIRRGAGERSSSSPGKRRHIVSKGIAAAPSPDMFYSDPEAAVAGFAGVRRTTRSRP
jgi:hypothetical protein